MSGPLYQKRVFDTFLITGPPQLAQMNPPRFGWLCNWIRGYPEPREIKCEVYLRSNNQRPRIVLEPTDYPLAVEQHRGITLERVKQIVATRGHSERDSLDRR